MRYTSGHEPSRHHRAPGWPQRWNAEFAAWACQVRFGWGAFRADHVPAGDVRQLLADRLEVDGIAVPGMPIGSPGMEMGNRRDAYAVYTFANGEKMDAFASHNQ